MRREIRRGAFAVVLAGTLIFGLTAVSEKPTAYTQSTRIRAVAAGGPCTSAANPSMARRLGNDIRGALRGRSGTVSVAVYDRTHKITCNVRSLGHFDSASVIKVTILGATLRRAIEQGRPLSTRESSLAREMITRSDNAAASALWRSLGRTRLSRFLRLSGMTHTALAPGGSWGLSQITAADQVRLLRTLTYHNSVLTDRSRAYALGLMSRVIPEQRWGTPAGAPPGGRVHVKNGWLPRRTQGWRVHSIGSFDGGGRDYMIAVLTHGNPTMAYGVRTIEGVAHAVHHVLNPGLRTAPVSDAPGPTWEVADGSVL